MIREVFIYHKDGVSIFHLRFDASGHEVSHNVFAGVSSAVNMFLQDLGHQSLHSINVGNGRLIYSSSQDFFFVVHAVGDEGEIIGPFLVKQIEIEFLKAFKDAIEKQIWNVVDADVSRQFKNSILGIHEDFVKLHESNRELFNFFPTDVPMTQLYELIKEGTDLIEGFPDDTIRLVRRLDKKYEESIKQKVFHSLGRYFGHRISEEQLKNKIGINPFDVLKLLNEISVANFEAKREQFILKICPVCRDKTSNAPTCHFYCGFIEGCFNNPKLNVIETSCKAKGDQNCIFQIKR
ncbi:MAG: V4R domain-containing protein [Candidatus Hodarchaeales archaeon]